MDHPEKKCIGHKSSLEVDESPNTENLKEEFDDAIKENLILHPIRKSLLSHWEVLSPAAPPRPTQISLGLQLKKSGSWPRPALGDGWHIRGGIGKRDILGYKSKIGPPFPRSHHHFGSVLTPEPGDLFTKSEKEQISYVPPPQHCAQLVRCVFDKYSTTFPSIAGRKSKEKVFPRDSRFEYRQIPPPEPPKENKNDYAYSNQKEKEIEKRIGLEPPFWYLDPEKSFSRKSMGSLNDYSKDLSINPTSEDPSIHRLLKEYELDKEGPYIPGSINETCDDRENFKTKPRGYISRLQEAGFLSEDNKTENFSNQNQYRYSLCLCPLIKELEMNTHSDSCLNLNKGPPEAGAYPDPICAHLKKPRPFPKPIEEFQWFLQPYQHSAQNLIQLKHPGYKPPIIKPQGKRAYPEMEFSNVMI